MDESGGVFDKAIAVSIIKSISAKILNYVFYWLLDFIVFKEVIVLKLKV